MRRAAGTYRCAALRRRDGNANGGALTDSSGNPYVVLRERRHIPGLDYLFTVLVSQMILTPYGPYPVDF